MTVEAKIAKIIELSGTTKDRIPYVRRNYLRLAAEKGDHELDRRLLEIQELNQRRAQETIDRVFDEA